jgi:hypothetical protein
MAVRSVAAERVGFDRGGRVKIAGMLFSVLAIVVASSAIRVSSASAGPASSQAVLDAPPDRVKQAAVAALEEAGYKVSQPRRSGGDVTARRARVVTHGGEKDDATTELERIAKVADAWQADVQSLSEYYVNVSVAMRAVDDHQTRIAVRAQITGARRTRGRRGAPMPVPIESNGVLEQELIAQIRERLSRGENSSP